MKIDAYSFGRIVVDGQEYRSDIIIFPDRVEDNWWRREGHRLAAEDLAGVLDDLPEVLVIGTGHDGRMMVPQDTLDHLGTRDMEVVIDRTNGAVEEFNRLARKHQRIVAALHLTC